MMFLEFFEMSVKSQKSGDALSLHSCYDTTINKAYIFECHRMKDTPCFLLKLRINMKHFNGWCYEKRCADFQRIFPSLSLGKNGNNFKKNKVCYEEGMICF